MHDPIPIPFAATADSRPALLVSACLLGAPVRYDGTAKPLPEGTQASLAHQWQLIAVCPERLGGLPTPRPAAEILEGDGRSVLAGQAQVCDAQGGCHTAAFVQGAHLALALAQRCGARHALLKAHSPSCGSGRIHDGQFGGTLRPGDGVSTALLREAGITVFSEQDLQHGGLPGLAEALPS